MSASRRKELREVFYFLSEQRAKNRFDLCYLEAAHTIWRSSLKHKTSKKIKEKSNSNRFRSHSVEFTTSRKKSLNKDREKKTDNSITNRAKGK